MKDSVLWNAVSLFNHEFAICVIWIRDMFISRIEFMISRNQFMISWKLISDMYISRIWTSAIRDMYISEISFYDIMNLIHDITKLIRAMYISRIQITHIANSGLNSKTAFHTVRYRPRWYIQQKCKQKPITHERSSVIWEKNTQNGNASHGIDPIGLTVVQNTPHRQTRSLS